MIKAKNNTVEISLPHDLKNVIGVLTITALRMTKNDRKKAAELLGVSVQQLGKYLKGEFFGPVKKVDGGQIIDEIDA